ncbi:hypothetical protein P175DRAFT_0555132 [Aspergillus ochraceoroseus IBT 24754]|uniref:Uncharacterized protein n=1 Tax=Aspergillus ochraceoroseus IBT 24754 TaxID=1392256 RepID=A0A2T5M1Q9_9EURO|nr:uncharacterized protein P175DRAFT_0555132 [Aspergillus ochraceoroseus IBT 24754]PTU22459.1 hypothetical protein P175DRAFT_0555132 [Aspergillus ochraceoroseus IBT 24754]
MKRSIRSRYDPPKFCICWQDWQAFGPVTVEFPDKPFPDRQWGGTITRIMNSRSLFDSEVYMRLVQLGKILHKTLRIDICFLLDNIPCYLFGLTARQWLVSAVGNETGFAFRATDQMKTKTKEGSAKTKRHKKEEQMTSAGLDPATLSVLTIRDNQLHQPAIVDGSQI